eukprot:2682883-Pleurochrysis_carterae.AAC.1
MDSQAWIHRRWQEGSRAWVWCTYSGRTGHFFDVSGDMSRQQAKRQFTIGYVLLVWTSAAMPVPESSSRLLVGEHSHL